MEDKFCPVRFVSSKFRTLGRIGASKKIEAESEFVEEENIEEEFDVCLKCAFSHKTADIFGDYEPMDNEHEEIIAEEIEPDSSLMEEAMRETDKLCKECAMMSGEELEDEELTDPMKQEISKEYPVVHSIVRQFEDLAEQLNISPEQKHAKSVTATLLSKMAHLQMKRTKLTNLSEPTQISQEILEEWLYYSSIAKLPYSFSLEALEKKLNLPLYENINLLDYQLNDTFAKQQLAHVIVEDVMREELLVTFRGTSDITTALFDAEFRPHKLKMKNEKVWVHSGMWAVAKKLWKQLSPFLAENRKKYKYLTICGHSLGAGVAVLFSFIANHYSPKEEIGKVSCFGIATPAVISSPNPEHHQRIVTLVLGDDIVPRLSFSSVLGLFTVASTLFDTVPGISSLLKGKKTKDATEALERIVSMTSTAERTEKTNNQLLPGGRIYHLSSVQEDLAEHKYHIVEAIPKYFHTFVLSPNGWKHHKLDLYRFYLASIITEGSISSIFE